jgi:hypothetical protein
MASMSKKHIEVEGKEILIKSSDGYMAIIPKDKTGYVKGLLDKKDFSGIDGYVKTLPKA